MTAPVEEFIEKARRVTIAEAAARLGLRFATRGSEHPQPCPACGGKDRFAFNTSKGKWHCRGAATGGGDAIGMAAHVYGLDVRRRAEFLAACALVTGEPVPEGGERESDEERAAREERLARQRAEREEEEAARAAAQTDFRERERQKARGIYEAAQELRSAALGDGRFYLRGRGCLVPDDRWLRVAADQAYWHGRDERGHAIALHSGPAMIAPFIRVGCHSYEIIGCHITWIDLAAHPKLRPTLADPDTGEILGTKKMRGTKKGGVIPLCGAPAARRWVGAEGIENTLAFARFEGARADTFYFASGDLGNLAGPADPTSRRAHPTLKKPDKTGRERPVLVAGPVPLIRERAADDDPDAMEVPDHVDELVLLGDGDSEPVMTAAAMVRAKARHARPGRLIPIVMARPGTDWAAMLAGHPAAFET